MGIGNRYIASVYWAFTTMTTVGYGDIYAQNNTERMYSIIIMILGATVFGYIVGSVAALVGQLSGMNMREEKLSQIWEWMGNSGCR